MDKNAKERTISPSQTLLRKNVAKNPSKNSGGKIAHMDSLSSSTIMDQVLYYLP